MRLRILRIKDVGLDVQELVRGMSYSCLVGNAGPLQGSHSPIPD